MVVDYLVHIESGPQKKFNDQSKGAYPWGLAQNLFQKQMSRPQVPDLLI